MLRPLALAFLFAPTLAAQPVVPRIEASGSALARYSDAPDAALAVVAPVRWEAPADWEAPPGLYWAGVGLDMAFVTAGAVLAVRGLRWIDVGEEAGLGGIPAVMLGSVAIGVGAGIGVVFGYDLARVASGDAPLLARMFDPTRLPDGTPLPPPEALPQPPPGLPPTDG